MLASDGLFDNIGDVEKACQPAGCESKESKSESMQLQPFSKQERLVMVR